MSEPERIVAKDLERWYAMVLPVILGYLRTQPQHCGGDEEEACLYSQAAYLCFTIALVALTASGPLPSASKTLQFCLFLLILGCSLLLSLAAPDMLGWAPYFSCIRPLFHLLPAEFQLRILHFSQPVWDNTKQLLILLSNVPSRCWILQSSKSEWNAIAALVAAGAIPNAQHSSPAIANLNSLPAVKPCEQQVCSREASTASLASLSSSDYHSNLEWVLKHLAELNLEQVHAHLVEEERLTVNPEAYPTITVALQKIYKDGGFYAGISPTLIGMLPYSTCYYFMYETMKKSYCQAKKKEALNRAEPLLVGALSGFTASTISFPLKVAINRLMVRSLQGKCPPQKAATLTEVIQEEALRGLYRGWVQAV